MNEEREEFELVAKACGIEGVFVGSVVGFRIYKDEEPEGWWNPKTDDGDALRLAANLRIEYQFSQGYTLVYAQAYDLLGPYTQEPLGDNPGAALRLVIWRAAVEYSRSLK